MRFSNVTDLVCRSLALAKWHEFGFLELWSRPGYLLTCFRDAPTAGSVTKLTRTAFRWHRPRSWEVVTTIEEFERDMGILDNSLRGVVCFIHGFGFGFEPTDEDVAKCEFDTAIWAPVRYMPARHLNLFYSRPTD